MDKSQGVQFNLCSTTQSLELIVPCSTQGSLAIDFMGNIKMETESQLIQATALVLKSKNLIHPP